MSLWSESPEWFEDWIAQKAMEGYFGEETRLRFENGNISECELWTNDEFWPLVSPLIRQAEEDYLLSKYGYVLERDK